MWKSLYAVLAAVLLLGAGGQACAQAAGVTIVKAGTGEVITPRQMAEAAAARGGVVVFGEYHDRAALHELEIELLQALHERQPRLALSLEMFERDVQPVMDRYLAGEITEAEFLAQSRPWPRYVADYRPLVEFAKARHLPVIAGNIPRYIAAQYAKEGVFAPEHQQYLPRRTYAPEGAYKAAFYKEMEGMGGEGMRILPTRYQAMYRAQCLKDDAMAERIADYAAAHADTLLYHVQGAFHGRGRLGVVEKLAALQPKLPVTLLSPVVEEEGVAPAALAKKYAGDGDYLLLLKETDAAAS